MEIKLFQYPFTFKKKSLRRILFIFIMFCYFPICPAQVYSPYIKYNYDELPVLGNGAKFYHCKYYSNVFGTEVGYLIYLPKHYFEVTDSIFPVMYYMPGSGGNYFSEAKRAMYWHEAMNDSFPEMVIVLTNIVEENYYMVKFEATLIDELRTHIINTYRVSDQGECSSFCGFSLGGQGAILIGLKHSDLFSQVISLSGAPFLKLGDQINYYLSNGTGKLNIRATVGTKDRTISSSRFLKEELTSAGIPFDYKEYEGFEHSSSQIFNDSAYRTETFNWQKECLSRTCPVPLRSQKIPAIGEFDLPFVNEYNPISSTPLPPNGFKFNQISPHEFQFSWVQSPKPVNGYVIRRMINEVPGYITLDTLSSDATTYIDSLEIVSDWVYNYQLITFDNIGTSSPATAAFRALKNNSASNLSTKSNLSISIYPNPTSNKLTIQLGDINPSSNISILISSINGMIILNQRVVKPLWDIDVSNFQKGLYLVNVTKDGKCINTEKFTVE
jgi:hypothetical protein